MTTNTYNFTKCQTLFNPHISFTGGTIIGFILQIEKTEDREIKQET